MPVNIVREGYSTIGSGWGVMSKKCEWVMDGLGDTSSTVMTTRAPAVMLKSKEGLADIGQV